MLARNTVLARGLDLLPRARTPLRGLYLWGGVGRGKTFLVDEFFAELPVREKRREHFHRLMQDVHARLRRHRNRASPSNRSRRTSPPTRASSASTSSSSATWPTR
jgi:predicted ATPase